jgi:uncharacterized protein YndB with AHSA1/START domain
MSDKPQNQPLEHKGRIMRPEIRSTATPQQAYDAWADQEKISHWFTDRADGKAEPGGTITWIFETFNYRIPYEVLVAQRPERLAVRWNPPPGTNLNAGILEVNIAREGGETVVRLVQSGFGEGAQWDEEFEGISSGWGMALARLKHYLENYYGVPRISRLLLKPADFSFEKLLAFHRTPEGLSKWLTKSGGFGDVGERFTLELQDGWLVSGHVLAKTKRETALSWEEMQGVLELKAFSMWPQRMLCVSFCSWGADEDRLKEIEGSMQRALDRLAAAVATNRATA